jgi:mycothiol maleylpyruvate isomerase-like protein
MQQYYLRTGDDRHDPPNGDATWRTGGTVGRPSRGPVDAPTACADWTAKDLTAHLLDGNQRRLSICRDGQRVSFPGGDLGTWLNDLNASWVYAARRLSPRLLIDLHKLVGPQIIEFWRSLDPHADAFFPVAWAGESRSDVWFDCARDFTEHWHHQQQIRETSAASLITAVDDHDLAGRCRV